MSIHYKFKSSIESDTIIFDGLHISVADLKKEIVQRKKLGKLTDFDLQITNAQTKEHYVEDDCLIPKNTTLVIARIPAPHTNKRNASRKDEPTDVLNTAAAKMDTTHVNLAAMEGTEEDKIEAMMSQSSAEYNPSFFQKIRGSQTGEVPLGYRCYKCKKTGHWIKNCPLNGTAQNPEVKRTTGIPRSFLDKDESSSDVPASAQPTAVELKNEIPDDLKCKLCNELLVDAVMIPCCGTSFCDECVRSFLLQSEENECPDCQEKNCSPSCVIPNRFLRKSVQQFRNAGAPNANSGKSVTKLANADALNERQREEDKTCSTELLSAEPETREINEESQAATGETAHGEVEEAPRPVEVPVVAGKIEPENKTINEEPANRSAKSRSPSVDTPPKPPGVEKLAEDAVSSPPAEQNVAPPGCDIVKHVSAPKSPAFDNPKPPGLENSPTYKSDYSPPRRGGQRHQHTSNRRYHPPNANYNANCEWDRYDNIHAGPPPPGPPPPHHMPNYKLGYPNHDMQAPPPGYMVRGPPPPLMSTHHGPPANAYAPMYPGMPPHVAPPGVIDDPLEAFNRIMWEKEQLKQNKRRSPDRHRSRTPESRGPGGRYGGGSPAFDRHANRDQRERRSREPERRRNPFHDSRKPTNSRHSPNDKKSKHSNSRSSPSSRNSHSRASPPRNSHQRASPSRNAYQNRSPLRRNSHQRSTPPRSSHQRNSPAPRNANQRLSPSKSMHQRGMSPVRGSRHQRPSPPRAAYHRSPPPSKSGHQRPSPTRNSHQRVSPPRNAPMRNAHNMRSPPPGPPILHQRLSPMRSEHRWMSPNRNAHQRLSPNRNLHHSPTPPRNAHRRRSRSRKSRSMSRNLRQQQLSPLRKRQRTESPRDKSGRKPNFEPFEHAPPERNDRRSKRRSRSSHVSAERMFSPELQFYEKKKHERSFTPPPKPDGGSSKHRSPANDGEFEDFKKIRRLSGDRSEERRRHISDDNNYHVDGFRHSDDSRHSESSEFQGPNLAEESGGQDDDSGSEKPAKERKKKKKDKDKNKKSKKEKKHKRSKSKKNKRKH